MPRNSGATAGDLATHAVQASAIPAAHELHIEIWRDSCVWFSGTAAQLQTEGLVPDGFEWPRAAASVHWEANGFSYWLHRSRPRGHKGPRRSWLEMDSWAVRVGVIGRDFHWQVRRDLERQAEQLQANYHSHTAAGMREWHERFDRYLKSREDRGFQTFKAMIPGLIPPKRGRKPNSRAA